MKNCIQKFPKLLSVVAMISFCFFATDSADAAKYNTSQNLKKTSDLVGLWSFDGKDVVNGKVKDRSGNGNDGSPTGPIASSTFYASGKIGQGFRFDGTDDYISIPQTDSLKPENFTISAWIKTTNSVDSMEIVSKTITEAEYNPAYLFSVSDYVLSKVTLFVTRGGGTYWADSTTTVTDGNWHHVVGTDNGSNVRIYVDGVLEDTSEAEVGVMQYGDPDPTYIGRYDSNGSYFNGSIDEVRMYNRALSAEEVKALYLAGGGKVNTSQNLKKTSGLVGLWSFDGKDVVGGVAMDRSGNANNLNLLGPIATSTFYSLGKIGQAFNLDGSNDYLNIADNTPLSITGPITISAWINRDTTGTADGIVGKWYGDADQRSYLLGINSNVVSFGISSAGNNATTLNGGTTISANRWYHVVGTSGGSGGSMNVYVDGVPDATPVSSTVIYNATSPLRIGDGDLGYWPFDGKIDEVRIYDRTLSASEVKALYLAGGGKGNASQNLKRTSGLVGLWSFDGKDVVNGVAMDRSGNSNNGNLVNIATSTFYASGKIGQGFNFDGSDSHVNAGSGATLTGLLGTSWTFSAWVKHSGSGYRTIASIGDATGAGQDRGFAIEVSSAHKIYVYYRRSNGGADQGVTGTTVLDTNWHHVVVSRTDGGQIVIYIDGVSDGSVSDPGDITAFSATRPFVIGAFELPLATTWPFSGLIDDARIYNRALSIAEITALYNMGR